MGIAVGIALSLLAARAFSKALYGVSAADALSFLGASFVLIVIAGLACYVPARVASKLNPLAGLRGT
jgi:ABC-type antimicrobial peptide transport system permease subunit